MFEGTHGLFHGFAHTVEGDYQAALTGARDLDGRQRDRLLIDLRLPAHAARGDDRACDQAIALERAKRHVADTIRAAQNSAIIQAGA